MHRNALALLLLAAAGCGARDDRAPRPIITPRAAPEPAPIAKGVPHGGDIVRVAVTEQGDAALSVDGMNSLRLWPALDGSRPPVPIASATEPRKLALLHAGSDMVAIVLDAAGGVQLTRVGLDGTVHGRVQLPGALYEEVAALDGGVLTRTSDHVIELFTPEGVSRGSAVPDPGERITHMAARNGHAAAIASRVDGTRLRWLALTPTLHWDIAMPLPVEPEPGTFALAPNRRRIAYLVLTAANTPELSVLDVDLMPVPVPGSAVSLSSASALGFVDDDTVGIAGSALVWWLSTQSQASRDPWDPASAATVLPSAIGAFADGKVVSASGSSLALATPTSSQFLGWDAPALGGIVTSGSELVLTPTATKFVWLDDQLHDTRSSDLDNYPHGGWTYGAPIGEHHVISQTHVNEKSTLAVFDADNPETRTALISEDDISQYWTSNNMVAVMMTSGAVRRFKLDLAATTATELTPAIRIAAYSTSFLRIFDPERADGLLLVAVTWAHESDEYQTLTYVRLENGKPKQIKHRGFDGQILRADPDGTLVVVHNGALEARIQVMRGDKVLREFGHTKFTPPLGIDAEARHFAMRDGTDVIMVDDLGRELWRTPVWGASNVVIASSGKRVVVAAPGGLMTLDAATGEPMDRECAFDFGLHPKPPAQSPLGFATLCEDPIVQ